MGSWLGLDIGTSSLKGLLVSSRGEVLARASVAYRTVPSRRGDAVEHDPAVWLDAAREAIATCVRAGGQPDGVGLTGQVPTLVLVDAAGAAVRPALSWQDGRAVAEAAALAAELGDAREHVGMDLPWAPSHLPAKLRWLAAHEPALIARTAWALQPKDHLGMQLTGSPLTDAWSSKGLLDVRDGSPAASVLAAAGWPVEVCPPAAAPWAARGVVGGAGAGGAGAGGAGAGAACAPDGLGLRAGIPVSVGWSDALTAMLGIGAFSAPSAFVLAGTSDIVGLSLAGDGVEAEGLYRTPPSCAPLALLYGPTQSSGATLAWLAELLDTSVAELPALAAAARDDSDSTFVPYLSGERAPPWRTDVRALFAGVSAEDGAPELARAVLRGVALSASHLLDTAARASGAEMEEVHVAGRALHDTAWQRIRLETLGRPLLLHEEPFTSALGAAMLGAAAAHDGDLGAAAGLLPVPIRIEPEEADRERAAELLAGYLRASTLSQAWSAA